MKDELRTIVWVVIDPKSGLIFGIEKDLSDAYRLQKAHETAIVQMQQMRPSDIPTPGHASMHPQVRETTRPPRHGDPSSGVHRVAHAPKERQAK